MIKIIADQRERSSGIIKELSKDFDVEVKQLVIADYLVQTKDLQGNILTVGIERKTTNDFLNSIIDKRLLSQLIEIKKHYQVPLLIIEGEENIYKIRDFHPNSIRGMLATIAVDFQIPIIYTKNYRDTAAFIAILAKRLEKHRSPIELLQSRKPLTLKEQQIYLLQSLPGIGSTLADSLLKHFKSVLAVFNASEEELQKVEKIGPKKASEIKKVLESRYS